jgi:hypothetical protein
MPMSEDKTPFIPAPDNDERGWDLVVKEGEVWLVMPSEMINLGPQDPAFTRMAELMAAEDFGER